LFEERFGHHRRSPILYAHLYLPRYPIGLGYHEVFSWGNREVDWAVPDRVIFAKKLTAVGVETHRAAVGYRDSFILDDIAFAVDGEKTFRFRCLWAYDRCLAIPPDLKRGKAADCEKGGQ